MKKTILITGATGSIGKATAFELANEGCNLVLLGRNAQKLASLKKEINSKYPDVAVDEYVADLSDAKAIRNAVQEMKKKYKQLDALVNIAALYKAKREANGKDQEMMFAANHLGPFVLTNEVLDLLKAGGASRVVTVSAPSSTKLNFDDLQAKNKFAAFTAFGGSKMANLLFTYALAKKIEGTGITATVYHPGLVKTELTNEMPGFLKLLLGLMSKKPDVAGKKLAQLAVADEYKNSNGKFFRYDGKELKSAPYSYDAAIQEKLWQESVKLTA
jgi:NAD(P)-dependent dehydrogenase (short-subunit alcohol dehydrogenase family)